MFLSCIEIGPLISILRSLKIKPQGTPCKWIHHKPTRVNLLSLLIVNNQFTWVSSLKPLSCYTKYDIWCHMVFNVIQYLMSQWLVFGWHLRWVSEQIQSWMIDEFIHWSKPYILLPTTCDPLCIQFSSVRLEYIQHIDTNEYYWMTIIS